MKSWWIVLVAFTLAGCGEEEGQRVPMGQEAEQQSVRDSWPAELTAAVDSANLAYSEQRYDDAATIYRGLAEEHTDVAAVWFGLYMSENALGNTEVAETALARAEELAPGLGQMHQDAESGGMGDAMRDMEMMGEMPEDHPPMTLPEGHPPMDSASGEDAPPLTDTRGSR